MIFRNFQHYNPLSYRAILTGVTLVLLQGLATLAGSEFQPRTGPFLNGKLPELAPDVAGNWSTVVAFPNLTFKNPIGLCVLPESSDLIVWEREGRIWSFANQTNAADKKLVLDLSKQCQGWDDSGLLGLAFHPHFKTNHFVYLWYAWVPPGTVEGDPTHRPRKNKPNHSRLSRFTLDASGVAQPSSELVLIDQTTRTIWHKGGGLFFHPKTGFLTLAIGEDEEGPNAQRLDGGLFGGLLRIDVNQLGGTVSHPISRQPLNGHATNYFIPNDNPFVGRTNALEEYYAIGLRSPYSMSHDRESGRTFIADVGAVDREELDVIEPSDPPGLNFQWPYIEGLNGDLKPPHLGVNKRPILDYDHGEGSAIIGGQVYRGKRWAEDLGGRYIFGDNGTGNIWMLDERAAPAGKTRLCKLPSGPGPSPGSNYTGLSAFGTDQEGELYLCQMSSEAGRIYRLQRTGPPPARKEFPQLLSQTGAFSDTPRLVPAQGLIAYTVNSPLWSDGAAKRRWLALPALEKIKFTEKEQWSFPNGTVFVKHFELPVDESDPQSVRRLETRLLVRDASGAAYGVTYKWRLDNRDAELLTNSLNEEITIRTLNGATRTQTWYYPSRTDCTRCHTPSANFVLGVNTRQLNCDCTDAETGATENQLRAWNRLGMFEPAIDEAKLASLDKLTSVTNHSAPLEDRVRSYLDSNCSHCHRPGGVHAQWDARRSMDLAGANIIDGPAQNAMGRVVGNIVKPRDLDRSLLYRRINSLDPHIKMPPVSRNVIDTSAIETIREWIDGLSVPTSLPAGWQAVDIGPVGLPGYSRFKNEEYVISGSGRAIGNQADGFYFASQPLGGDGEIQAHIASVSNADPDATAGVMIRESTEANARVAFMGISTDQLPKFQHRNDPGGASEPLQNHDLANTSWVKLERKGSLFTGWSSSNGSNWTKIAEVTIPMKSATVAGLAVSAHDTNTYCITIFDKVGIRHRQ